MNPLKPLLFLTARSLVNGVKRALTTPRRLISFIIFVGYYFFIFVRPAFSGKRSVALPNEVSGQFELPPIAVIDGITFGVFALLSLLMMMGVASATANFKPADVDVLFSTPISPRVLLIFRIIRDYLITLIVPLLMLIFTITPAKLGYEKLIKNVPPDLNLNLALKAMGLSWLVMAMVWVTISYAVSLFINRSDKQSDRNRKIIGWSLAGLVVVVGTFLFYNISQSQSAADALAITHAPFLRTIFFTASFSAMITTAPLDGSYWGAVLGLGAMLTIIVVSIRVAMTQVGWMYDQAAVRGFDTQKFRDLQKSGDVMAYRAVLAREGKIKANRGAWIKRWRPRGAWALIWKEYLLQVRGGSAHLLTLALTGTFIVLMMVFLPTRRQEILGPLLVGSCCFSLFLMTVSQAQMGFMETLRRVDLQKPMPFSSMMTVLSEVLSKSIFGAIVCMFSSSVAMIAKPGVWAWGVAALLIAIPLSLLLGAVSFLVVMLFPDLDDPSQRQFRGLMLLLGIALFGLFPVGAFVGIAYFAGAPIVGALVSSAIALAIATGVCFVSGQLYATFNPSE